MTLCKDCKFWDTTVFVLKDLEYNEGWGECVCEDEKFDSICYMESINGELLTREDFACICGELKENYDGI